MKKRGLLIVLLIAIAVFIFGMVYIFERDLKRENIGTNENETWLEINFSTSYLREFLVAINMSDLAKEEWWGYKQEKKRVLIIDYVGEKKWKFLLIPSRYCWFFGKEGEHIWSVDLENVKFKYRIFDSDFWMYKREVNRFVKEYSYCFAPYSLATSPILYLENEFYLENAYFNIPKNCSEDINEIGKECVKQIALQQLKEAIDFEFNDILKSPIAGEKVKQKAREGKEEFKKMTPSIIETEVYITKYVSSGAGVLVIAQDEDNKILGFIEFQGVELH